VGRRRFELLTPAMSRLNLVRLSAHSSGISHWLNSSPEFIANEKLDWQQFHNFLLQRMSAKTAEDRIRYAKHYASLLIDQNLVDIQQLSPNKRIHVMKALSCLAKFLGCYDSWTALCRKYQPVYNYLGSSLPWYLSVWFIQFTIQQK
jgi:hypothetical protein